MKIFFAIVGVLALLAVMGYLMYDPAVEESSAQAVVTGKYIRSSSDGETIHLLYYLRMRNEGEAFEMCVNSQDYECVTEGDHFTVKKVRHKSGAITYGW